MNEAMNFKELNLCCFLQGSLLIYLRGLKELYLPQWKNDAATHGDLESLFKITWAELTGYAKQAAQGMAFLEEKKVQIYLCTNYSSSIIFFVKLIRNTSPTHLS